MACRMKMAQHHMPNKCDAINEMGKIETIQFSTYRNIDGNYENI